MCFHAQQTQSATAVHQRFQASGPVSQGSYNGFAHPAMTVLTDQLPHRLQLYHWGLIPHWAKDSSIQKYTLNARMETLSEKPSFRKAGRCLVIADGFIEWQWQDPRGHKKQKYQITLPDNALFAFAGLWDVWTHPSTGVKQYSCAIVTQAAVGVMKEIHNSKLRMPLILSPNAEQDWLQGQAVAAVTSFKATPI